MPLVAVVAVSAGLLMMYKVHQFSEPEPVITVNGRSVELAAGVGDNFRSVPEARDKSPAVPELNLAPGRYNITVKLGELPESVPDKLPALASKREKDEEKKDEKTDAKKDEKKEKKPFEDRVLQKALDHLRGEIKNVGAMPVAMPECTPSVSTRIRRVPTRLPRSEVVHHTCS